MSELQHRRDLARLTKGQLIDLLIRADRETMTWTDEQVKAAAREFQRVWDENYDRLRRAFADIAAHVEAWERGPVTDRPVRAQDCQAEPDTISTRVSGVV